MAAAISRCFTGRLKTLIGTTEARRGEEGDMQLDEAQREVREVYLGGWVGAFASAAVWLASAALATWSSHTNGALAIIFGGMLIFPLTMLGLRLMGRRATLRHENPLGKLAMQVAFTVPLSIPLILAAAQGKPEWFYAGFLVVVGAHYLPFVTLYGQPAFYPVAGVMVGAGFVLPLLRPGEFAIGGWVGGAMFIVLGFVLAALHARDSRGVARPAHSP